MKLTLAIDHCPKHGFFAISVNNRRDDGWGGGTRLTQGKCCGTWQTFKEWSVTPAELREAANELLEYADQRRDASE